MTEKEAGENEVRPSGDTGVGYFLPENFHPATFERVSPAILDKLRKTSGLVATTSDVLEELGWNLTVPACELAPRHEGAGRAVGQAITLRYLPTRLQPSRWQESGGSRLAHHTALSTAKKGDVLVIEIAGLHGVSAFGGLAARAVLEAGLYGVIIEGGSRDADQVHSMGLPMWTRYVTPVSGKFRAEATGINVGVAVGSVHVEPGDIVCADATGTCFIPVSAFPEVAERVLEVSLEEIEELAQHD
jgi:4-hydroxy-4-methyl-2-oxoglutarate aldolase